MDVVYIISAGPEAHKIGRTRNMKARLSALQNAHGRELTLVGCAQVSDACAVERRAHAELKEHRLRGEWFAVSADRAIDAVVKAAARPPHQTFFEGSLACCIKASEEGSLEVGAIYTVKHAYIGEYVELVEVEKPGVCWNPAFFVRVVGVLSVVRVSDPGDVI